MIPDVQGLFVGKCWGWSVTLIAGLQGWEGRLKISDRAHIGEDALVNVLCYKLSCWQALVSVCSLQLSSGCWWHPGAAATATRRENVNPLSCSYPQVFTVWPTPSYRFLSLPRRWCDSQHLSVCLISKRTRKIVMGFSRNFQEMLKMGEGAYNYILGYFLWVVFVIAWHRSVLSEGFYSSWGRPPTSVWGPYYI